MLGMRLRHQPSGIVGTVDAATVDPSGSALVRIDDHWFFASDCVAQSALDGA